MGRGVKFTLHTGAAQPLPADWRRLLDRLPQDLRDLYEERAALIEYDGGEKRKTAERRAFECLLRQGEAAAFLAEFSSQRTANGGGVRKGAGETAARMS